MASRGASLLAGCGWMTPLRVPFSQSLALALLRQPLLPRRRRGSNGTKCVRRSVRTVIHEVIADIDTDAAEIVLLIHWVGGVHTEIRLPRRRRGQRTSTSADVIAAVRQLVLIANDDLIAGILNRNGLVTGYGNRWTRERVTSLRSYHGIAVYKPAADGIEPWLNLNNAARLLQVAPKTLRVAAEAGKVEALHPLPDGPWIFSRAVLSTAPARAITDRARQNPRHPAGAAVLPGKLDNIGGETLLVVTTARDLASDAARAPHRCDARRHAAALGPAQAGTATRGA